MVGMLGLFMLMFFLGASTGSFLHAWSFRMQRNESILKKHSHCDKCHHPLHIVDLIPILSFIFLQGACRYCHTKLSKNHLFIEGMTGLLFVLAAYRAFSGEQLPMLFFRDIILISAFIFIFIHDATYRIIPDSVVLPTAVITFFVNISLGASIKNLLIGIMVTTGFFGIQYLLSKGKAIGQGDITLGILMGAALGLKGSIVALTITYILGALVASFLLVKGTHKQTDEIPLGSFLAIGSLVALFLGEKIASWYLALL